jgi:hypothetical protein
MDKSLTEISIKQPKQYRILTAIAHGLHNGKPLQEIFKALNISNSYGYAVWRRFKLQIKEITTTLGARDEQPQNDLLTAKKFLKAKSPEFAEIIYDLAKDEKAPARERVQAAKTGLQIAGVDDATEEPPDISRYMRNIILNIFYGKPLPEETRELIDITANDTPENVEK